MYVNQAAVRLKRKEMKNRPEKPKSGLISNTIITDNKLDTPYTEYIYAYTYGPRKIPN